MSERRFELPDGRGQVVFTEPTLRHMYSFSQKCWWNREAGGQLFSLSPDQPIVEITLVTGPHYEDRRSRCGFVPDLARATRDRHEQFANGRHAVGLWHTHPEIFPMPSDQDRQTTQEYLDAFQGAMEGFLLVILGNRGIPLNMTVWMACIQPGKSWVQLTEH